MFALWVTKVILATTVKLFFLFLVEIQNSTAYPPLIHLAADVFVLMVVLRF